jgi:hypothetical protein
MWDSVEVDQAEKVTCEHNLTANEQFWEPMVKQGSRIARHSSSRDSAMSIIDSIIKRQRTIVLEIQDEMMNNRLRLDETKAGKSMSRLLLERRTSLQQHIRMLRDEMQKAEREKNPDSLYALFTQYQHFRKLFDIFNRQDLDQQVRNLRVSFENLKWEREQEFEKSLDEMSQRAADW